MSLTHNRPSPMVIFTDDGSRCGGLMKFRLVTKTPEIVGFRERLSHARSSSHTRANRTVKLLTEFTLA